MKHAILFVMALAILVIPMGALEHANAEQGTLPFVTCMPTPFDGDIGFEATVHNFGPGPWEVIRAVNGKVVGGGTFEVGPTFIVPTDDLVLESGDTVEVLVYPLVMGPPIIGRTIVG